MSTTPVTTSNPTSRPQKGKRRPAKTKATKTAQAAVSRSSNLPRADLIVDDDDVLLSGGGLRGTGYGRCGGRILTSKLEQTLCDLLSKTGLTHSHQPRQFEVPISGGTVGAYAPLIVLRGRGRGGKTVVIEVVDEIEDGLMGKIIAFRNKFSSEFYIIFVAPEETIDLIPMAAYDESCVSTDLGTLINRLAD